MIWRTVSALAERYLPEKRPGETALLYGRGLPLRFYLLSGCCAVRSIYAGCWRRYGTGGLCSKPLKRFCVPMLVDEFVDTAHGAQLSALLKQRRGAGRRFCWRVWCPSLWWCGCGRGILSITRACFANVGGDKALMRRRFPLSLVGVPFVGNFIAQPSSILGSQLLGFIQAGSCAGIGQVAIDQDGIKVGAGLSAFSLKRLLNGCGLRRGGVSHL